MVAAIARHKRLAALSKELLKAASWGWDEPRMHRAIKAYVAEFRKPWPGGARAAADIKARPLWTLPTKPLDYFKEAGSGRTPLLVACAAAGEDGCGAEPSSV